MAKAARSAQYQAVQLVTIGQRRGLGFGGQRGAPFATGVDVAAGVVKIGTAADLLADRVVLERPALGRGGLVRPGDRLSAALMAQPCPGHFADGELVWDEPQRRVASGQAVVLYSDGDMVLGGGIAR